MKRIRFIILMVIIVLISCHEDKPKYITEIEFPYDLVNLVPGEEVEYEMYVKPSDTDYDVVYKVINPDFLELSLYTNEKIQVKARQKGSTVIWAESGEVKNFMEVWVREPNMKLKFKDNSIYMRYGTSRVAEVSYEGEVKWQDVKYIYEGKDEGIVKIVGSNETGVLLEAMGVGRGMLYARTDNYEASIELTVGTIGVESLFFVHDSVTIVQGEEYGTLGVQVRPGNFPGRVEYEVDREEYCRIVSSSNERCLVEGLKAGTTFVTVRADGREAVCVVNVLENPMVIKAEPMPVLLNVGEYKTVSLILYGYTGGFRWGVEGSSGVFSVNGIPGGQVLVVGGLGAGEGSLVIEHDAAKGGALIVPVIVN